MPHPSGRSAGPVNVTFLAVDRPLPAIQTQAVRLSAALGAFDDGIQTRLLCKPANFFASANGDTFDELLNGCDVLIAVKPRLFTHFMKAAKALKTAAARTGTVVVAHPCDGVEEQKGAGGEPFAVDIADYALAVSNMQSEALRQARGGQGVINIGHAYRLDGEPIRRDAGGRIRAVLWENPVHYNPGMSAAIDMAPHRELERVVREICDAHGAELRLVTQWLPPLPDKQWRALALESGVAMECKALDHRHTPAQRQKAAVKVLNYLAAGLPVICDSLPAYRSLADEGALLLFADSVQEWRDALERLLGDAALRQRMVQRGADVASRHSIEAVARRLASAIHEMIAEDRLDHR